MVVNDVKAAAGGVEGGDVRRQLWPVPSSAGQTGAPQIPHQVKIVFHNRNIYCLYL